jgi:hypothetical protein
MTATYEPPGLKGIGSLHAVTLAHEEGPNAGVGSFQAPHGNPICVT